MKNSYKKSMNKIKFTEDEKNQMKENLMLPHKKSASKYLIQFASLALIFFFSLFFILKQNTSPSNTVYTIAQSHPYFLNQETFKQTFEEELSFEKAGAPIQITIKEISTDIIDKIVYTTIEAVDKDGKKIHFQIQGGVIRKEDWDQNIGLELPGYNEELEIAIPTGYIFPIEREKTYFLEEMDDTHIRLYQARESNGIFEMYVEEANEWISMP